MSEEVQKTKATSVGLWKYQQEAISWNWLKLAKRKLYCFSPISVPQTQSDHPEFDQSSSLNAEFYEFA